ncbi:MAG TPA: ferrous iron transport protein A [Gammaproteobacteria bacterium]|nr:ferrous iron transport protein A [Gammaproteobacteria bacterium]
MDTRHKFSVRPGMECTIRSLGDNAGVAQRLAQMGVLPGATLRVVRLAPFGKTVEVCMDQGQSFALREEEVRALDCQLLAMPLSSAPIDSEHEYRVRSLAGGKAFQQRMRAVGLQPGKRFRVPYPEQWPLILRLEDSGQTPSIGKGEADKIIVETGDE